MSMLILPGASGPFSAAYKPVYEPLIREAERRFPGTKIKCLSFPGQEDANGERNGELLIPDAATFAERYIRDQADPISTIIARSTGCSVAAMMMANWSDCPIRKAVFLGPPPFWIYWHLFIRHKAQSTARADSTGTTVTERLAQCATPYESLLPSATNCRFLMCTGTQDEYCPPPYFDYLRMLWASNSNIDFAVVQNCPHTVTASHPNWSDYVETIFGWIASQPEG